MRCPHDAVNVMLRAWDAEARHDQAGWQRAAAPAESFCACNTSPTPAITTWHAMLCELQSSDEADPCSCSVCLSMCGAAADCIGLCASFRRHQSRWRFDTNVNVAGTASHSSSSWGFRWACSVQGTAGSRNCQQRPGHECRSDILDLELRASLLRARIFEPRLVCWPPTVGISSPCQCRQSNGAKAY